jgi:hypothetical protein
MATLRKIITDAYRESGIIQKGSNPDADQMQEGLDKLLMLIENVFGEEVGSHYQDVNYGDDGVNGTYSVDSNREVFIDNSYARPSYRLLVNSTSAKTIYLDPAPYDGARFSAIDVGMNFTTAPITINADTRKIEGAQSVTLSTDGASVAWFYRADLAEWVKIAPLTLDSDCPFPFQFDDYFMMKLATRLFPRYLVQTSNETMMHYREIQRKFKTRYSTTQEMNSETALYRLRGSRYLDYFIEDSSIRFNRGIIY